MNHRKIFLYLAVLVLASCGSNPPECNYEGENSVQANAGCLIIEEGKILITEGIFGAFQLPAGTMSGGEPAQCTAERETWEETGLTVRANNLFKKFENGFMLFDCDVIGNQAKDGSDRPLGLEVKNVHWLGSKDFAGKKWRYPDQAKIIKKYLEEM